MEILKIFIEIAGTLVATTGGTNYTNDIYIMTRNAGTTAPVASDGSIIIHERIASYSDGSSTGRVDIEFPIQIDLTDGAGHGMLVATDNLYLTIFAASATVPFTGAVTCKCMYRFKKVSLQEYIGIVQSQQTA